MVMFDQDGEPVMTEQEEREEFVLHVCERHCDAEMCPYEDCPIECPRIKQALRHFDAWGGYDIVGSISCPSCPACGYAAAAEPVFTEEIGSLVCTICGHRWSEMPREKAW